MLTNERNTRTVSAPHPASLYASSDSSAPLYKGADGPSRQSISQPSGLVAVYGNPGLAPAVVRVEYTTPLAFTRDLIDIAFACASESASGDSPIPLEVFSELIANLVHAGYADPVISILESGRVLRVSDCGPGVPDKRLAIEPGYTSAAAEHRKYIRGVGAGLHIVQIQIEALGGSLRIDDNIGGGTVVTASLLEPAHLDEELPLPTPRNPLEEDTGRGVTRRVTAPQVFLAEQSSPLPNSGVDAAQAESSVETEGSVHLLSPRQREVLYMVMASSEVGPTAVANTLGIPLTTAYRDLALLERMELVKRTDDGKRVPTETLMQSSTIWRNL